jgi:NAD(P)-dependent dehydrogenase (short-subunit alcohol dehydrogenase family)
MMDTQRRLIAMTSSVALFLATSRLARRRRSISFADRVVVITGGSRGLGLVMARRMGREGARLALLARSRVELDRAAAELASANIDVFTKVCDVGDTDQVQLAFDAITERFGAIDVLINKAGIIQVGPLEHMTSADFVETMRVHFWGPLHCMTAVLPEMQARGFGRIVNIGSIGGEVAVPHLGPYAASKFALTGLSNAVRTEVWKYGIRITTVSPGLMRTGSPVNALMKGQQEKEFSWFATLSSLPFVTMSAERAAARIIDACRHGDPYLCLTPQARFLIVLDALAPSISATLLRFGNRFLPSPDGSTGDLSFSGREARPPWLPAMATALTDRAAVANNELPSIPPPA